MSASRAATGSSGIAISALLLLVLAVPAPAAPSAGRPAAAAARPHVKTISRSLAKRLGLPQAPRVLFQEDFEHEMTRRPVLLTKYVGAPPLSPTYTANQRFLENCNGYIVQFESNERVAATDCEEVAFNRVRQLAWALGQLRGVSPTANHAVSAYTDGHLTLPANTVQFETVNPIPVQAKGRFITFSVDAAETNCAKNHAEFKFSLLEGPTEIPTFTSPIDPCTAKGAKTFEPPQLGTKTTEAFKAGTFPTDAASLFTGTELGIRMRNAQVSETGNDAAFDNIRILDATPQLEKSFSPTVVNVDGISELTYTITNTSELGEKSGWSFTDTLPADLVVASPAKGVTTCPDPTTIEAAGGGSTIAVTNGKLASGSAYCTVTVEVTSGKEGTYTNGPGNIVEKGLEPPEDATVEFADNADVAIEKLAAPNPGLPGANLTYTLKVTNHGPDAAKDVVVSDPLPAGLSFVSASPPCAPAGAEVKCELGSLAVGASQTLTIVAHIPESATDGFVNTATVSSTTPDPDLSNNSSTAPTPLQPEADLAIKKIAEPTKLTAGGEVAYVLLVHNYGPSDATDVTVTDPLHPSLSLVAIHPSQGNCSTAAGIVCHLGGVARDAGAQIFVLARVDSNAAGKVPNTAGVTGGQIDPNPDNNSSTAEIEVAPLTPDPLPPPGMPETHPRKPAPPQPFSDMKIVKSVNRGSVKVGQRLVYTLDVSNLGPDTAADVRLTDTWSLGFEVLSVHPSQGHCGGLPLVCSLGAMKSGASARIRVVAVAKEPGRERNTARVTSASRDPDLSNNESEAESAVTAKPRPAPVVTG